MSTVFADTAYYLGLLNPKDQCHAAACEFTDGFSGKIVTTAWVLTELASSLRQPPNRSLFVELLNDLHDDVRVRIHGPTQELFDRGLELYADRPDKAWSLVDCISFCIMADESLTDALTADRHFEQAGFTVLLK